MTPKELTLRTLHNARSDDTYRAKAAFRGLSAKEMTENYGQSGKTRQQIIDEYETSDRQYDAAIAWVESQS